MKYLEQQWGNIQKSLDEIAAEYNNAKPEGREILAIQFDCLQKARTLIGGVLLKRTECTK